MKCPCRGCPDRTITCRGVCKRYQDWKQNHEDERKWIREQGPLVSDAMIKKANDNVRRKARGWKRSKGGNHDG